MPNTARRIAWGQPDTIQDAGKASGAVRPLGSLEHLFWLMDQTAPIHFAMTAQVTGETEPGDWRMALDRLQERHPLLSVAIERTGSGPQFRHSDAPIPLRVVKDDPQARWEAEVAEELAAPFDPSRAPLARAVLIHRSERAAFTFVAHHSICDGMSAAYAMRDTLSALSGRALEPLPLPSSQEQLVWPNGMALAARLGSDGQPQADLPGQQTRPTSPA
jgi:hypothetical protein